MYRSCIFCSADLKANDALERFPVGRGVAFDGEKGRLWAICRACGRWNLAPIEERWEAVEDAERLFRETRVRVQSENIGLAKLRDGTRLVRVGAALPGELAVWRYGTTLRRRRTRFLLASGASIAVAAAAAGALAAGGAMAALYAGHLVTTIAITRARTRRVVYRPDAPGGAAAPVRRRDVHSARLALRDAGLELHFPGIPTGRAPGSAGGGFAKPLVLRGDAARLVLGRAMVAVNDEGADRAQLLAALSAIQAAGSAEALLMNAGRDGLGVNGARGVAPPLTFRRFVDRLREGANLDRPAFGFDPFQAVGEGEPDPRMALALEMALHEETERRALEGELAGLEAAWRQAEEIAAIADALPDTVPAPEPPRIGAQG